MDSDEACALVFENFLGQAAHERDTGLPQPPHRLDGAPTLLSPVVEDGRCVERGEVGVTESEELCFGDPIAPRDGPLDITREPGVMPNGSPFERRRRLAVAPVPPIRNFDAADVGSANAYAGRSKSRKLGCRDGAPVRGHGGRDRPAR
jgi:hypothetical protein